MRVLIVGCGYVGLPLGGELAGRGHEVFGLGRGAAAADGLKAAGIRPLVADITKPGDLEKLPRGYDWVVNCASSGGGSAGDYRRLYFEGSRNLVEWLLPEPPAKYVYTSSTAVYGQNDGSLVAETDPTAPETGTGKVLVETEQFLLSAAAERNFPAVILRVAGIYGPGRGFWLKKLLGGEARIEGGGGRFLNMIHRDDVVGAVIAALERAPAGSVFNAVDDEPVSQARLLGWLAERLGMPPPAAEEDAGEARRRGVTNKRVSNLRLRTVLGFRPGYATYREGYGAEIARLGGGGG